VRERYWALQRCSCLKRYLGDFSTKAYRHEDTHRGKGVERLQPTIPQFTIPKITGAVAESVGSEYLGSSAQNLAEKVHRKLEKKSNEK